MMQAFDNAISGLPVCEIDRIRMKPEIGRFDYGKTQKVKFENIAFNSVEKKKPTPEDVSTYIGLEHLDSGTFIVSRWGGDVAPVGDKLVMKKGDVLFGKRRAYQRKVAIAPFDGIFSAHGMVLRPRTDVVDARFFPFFIASDQFMNEAVRISVGGLSPTINWKTLKECEFDLPPIEKQRELAELLWAANDLKESYKKLITATDEMLKAKFREMFGECGMMSAECGVKWPTVELVSVCRRSGEYGMAASADSFDESKGRYIRITDITDDGSLNDDVVSPNVCDEKCRLQVNDVLFARTGNTVGKTYIHKHGFCTYAGYLIRYVTNPEVMSPDYLFSYTHTQEYLKWVENTKKIGAQPNISASQYDKMPIPLPPLALQQEFVEIARKADETKAVLKKSIADVDQVIKGMINK